MAQMYTFEKFLTTTTKHNNHHIHHIIGSHRLRVLELRMDQYSPDSNIDDLLQAGLIGATIEKDLSAPDAGLSILHPFSWETIMADPKGNHGVVQVRGSWYKTMNYEVLHSGGFLRLYTLRGRSYWNAQNETEHTTPDWKLHFSCALSHVGLAWNSLAALFIDMKCEIGMKATVLNHDQWSENQRGREITVYIYSYHHSYDGYMQGVVPEHDHDLYLGRYLKDIYGSPFWFNFIQESERRLAALGIESRGVAVGDLPLPGCRYASLRNEAYIPVPEYVHMELRIPETKEPGENSVKSSPIDQGPEAHSISTLSPTASQGLQTSASPMEQRLVKVLKYPPNDYGWNAARHPNPLLEVIFFLRAIAPIQRRVEELESIVQAVLDKP